jgi:hypothetical protein
MTAKKKSALPKFTGELAEPILAPLDLLAGDGQLGESFYIRLEARIRKLAALAKHYDVEPNNWFLLAYTMACDLVPGFQVLYDDPRARARQLPDAYYGNGTKAKGSGKIPEWLDGDVLIWIFRLFKEKFPRDYDNAIAERIVLCMDEGLAGPAHEKERMAIGKTLRNRLSKARNAAPA